MDRQNQIVIDMQKIIDAIDSFRSYKTAPETIVSRIRALAVYEKQQAELQIDMKLEQMEREWNLG